MIISTLVVISAVLPYLLCQGNSQDSLCRNKVCPNGQACRHFKPCGQNATCNVTAICTATTSNRGGCKFGDTVLFNNNGAEEDLICDTDAPCPSNAYCSTALQDIAAVCCLSDPAQKAKTDLTCPEPQPNPDRIWCVDECKSDGDCIFPNQKCCNTGCSLKCIASALPEVVSPPPPPTPSALMATSTSNDPCEGKVCPSRQVCRHYKPCGLEQVCNVTGICTENKAGKDGCMHGSPILYDNKGSTEMLICYREAPCPSNAYCSTVLMDTSSRCCLTDPEKQRKPGICPVPNHFPVNQDDYLFCYDECKNDFDCDWDDKCCMTGCKLECIPPSPDTKTIAPPPRPSPPTRFHDPCDNKLCPANMYCRRIGQPCRDAWDCRREGECNRCPFIPLSLGAQTQGFEIINDPDGCPTIVMNQRRPSLFPRRLRRGPIRMNPLDFLLLNELYNKK